MRNKSKEYIVQFTFALIVIFTGYFFAVKENVFYLEERPFKWIAGTLAAIFLLGSAIIAPGLRKTPENFSARFLVLTVFQMLAVLSMILVFMVKKMEPTRTIAFHLISVFCLILAIQSYLLIRVNTKE